MTEQRRFGQIVGDQHHRLSQALEDLRQLVLQLGAHQGIQRAQRFVEEQQLRIQHERPHERHPLPLAARELVREAQERAFGKARQRRQLRHARGDARARPAQVTRHQRHVAGGGQVRKQAAFLDDVPGLRSEPAEARRTARIQRRLAMKDFSGVRADQAQHQAQDGRLAAAAGPDEHGGPLRPDIQVGLVNRRQRPEAFGHAHQAQDRRRAIVGAGRVHARSVPSARIAAMSRKERLVLLAAILGSFVAFLDMSVVNVALPAIRRALGGGIAAQQWIVDAYLLSLSSLILIAGSVSDLFGRKRVFAAGLIGFGVTSLLCAVAPGSTFLIVARGLQGIAGALLVPSSLAMILSSFSGDAQGRAIGIWTAWTGIAFIVGPLAGGLLVAAGWRWVFAVNVLPIAATLLVVARLPPDGGRTEDRAVDLRGAALCAAGLGGLTFALIEQPRVGWGVPWVWLPFAAGLVTLAAFLLWERAAPAPMLDFALFRNRNFAVGNVATLAIYAGLSASTFLLTIFLQQGAGYSALTSGLALLPVTLLMFTLSPRFARLAARHGPRLFMTAGPIVAGLGLWMLGRIGARAAYPTDVLPGVLAFGLGLAATVAPLTAAILAGVGERQAGVASAVNNAIARVAGLLAVAAVGARPFGLAMSAAALLLWAGAVISAAGIRNPRPGPAAAT